MTTDYQVLVLKQSWRPSRTWTEYELYRKLEDRTESICQILCSAGVRRAVPKVSLTSAEEEAFSDTEELCGETEKPDDDADGSDEEDGEVEVFNNDDWDAFDTTLSIRGNVVSTSAEWESLSEKKLGEKRPRSDEVGDAARFEKILHLQMVKNEDGSWKKLGPFPELENRVLTRTLMDTYGWPLKHFTGRVNLLVVVCDCASGMPFISH